MERIRVTFVKEVCSEEWENCFPRFLSQRQHLFQFHCCELGPVSIPNQWSLARRVELCCWMLTWAFRALGEVGFPQIRVISKGWKPVSTAGWIYILFIVDLHVLAHCVVLWSIEVSMNIWLFFVVVIKQPFIYIYILIIAFIWLKKLFFYPISILLNACYDRGTVQSYDLVVGSALRNSV